MSCEICENDVLATPLRKSRRYAVVLAIVAAVFWIAAGLTLITAILLFLLVMVGSYPTAATGMIYAGMTIAAHCVAIMFTTGALKYGWIGWRSGKTTCYACSKSIWRDERRRVTWSLIPVTIRPQEPDFDR